MTALLVNPSSFEWAKKCMTSQAWQNMSNLSSGLHFTLPAKCPILPTTSCFKDLPDPKNKLVLEDQVEIETTCTTPPSQKGKGKAVQEKTSPGSPFDQIPHKISPSSGPWSKSFLDQAENAKQAAVLKDPHKRRSQRMQNLKMGFKDP
jgi:hypothetical protein